MLTLSGMIVANVGTDYINTYLKSKKYAKEDEGKAVEYWVNDLIARERLDIDDFENFLFDELSFGKRKSIRVYKIDNAYKLKDSENWLNQLRENYGINSLEFKNIMTSIPSYKEPERIAAISSEFDYRGNVTRIRILFTAYAEVEEKGKIHATGAYYPSDIIIFMLSSDFLDSYYCYDIEMKKAIEREKRGECKIIPVIVRACMWDETPLKNFLAFPKDGKSIEQYERKDDAYLEIAKGVREIVQSME